MKALDTYDWAHAEAELDSQGHVALPALFTTTECEALITSLQDPNLSSEPIALQAVKQGHGELRHFRELPDDLAALRRALYGRVVELANRWQETMGVRQRYAQTFAAFSGQNGESRLTSECSALSRLQANDHWGFHRDVEDERSFPLQVSALLSRPERDFSGGEFVLIEQRPRMQTRPVVLVPKQGDAIIFAAYRKPFRGAKGFYRVSIKHAVSRVHRGARVGLELFF